MVGFWVHKSQGIVMLECSCMLKLQDHKYLWLCKSVLQNYFHATVIFSEIKNFISFPVIIRMYPSSHCTYKCMTSVTVNTYFAFPFSCFSLYLHCILHSKIKTALKIRENSNTWWSLGKTAEFRQHRVTCETTWGCFIRKLTAWFLGRKLKGDVYSWFLIWTTTQKSCRL